MMESYRHSYNDRVVREGEPYDKEALHYLDAEFKSSVTAAIETCLNVRPEDAIRFLAEELKSSQKRSKQKLTKPHAAAQCKDCDARAVSSEESRGGVEAHSADQQKEFVLTYPGGVACTVQSATAVHCTSTGVAASATASSGAFAPATAVLDGLPFYRMVAPTAYDVDAVLRKLDACAPGGLHRATDAAPRTLIVVEPPTAPTELFFLEGIPYYTNLADTLAQHHRRSNRSAPSPSPEQTYAHLALSLLTESLGTRITTLPTMLDSCGIQPLTLETSSQNAVSDEDERIGVLLPAVQSNYLEVFDLLDAGVQFVMGGSPRMPLEAMSTVLFITYNTDVEAANLTLARLLAAYLPHLEAQQRHGLAAMREAGRSTIRELSYENSLRYWDEVHDRRESRDEARGVRRVGSRRLGRAATAGGGAAAPLSAANSVPASPKSHISLGQTKKEPKADDPATEALRKKTAQARDARRQSEDAAFLGVLHELRDRAATSIQALYRGWRTRKTLASMGLSAAPSSAAPLSDARLLNWTKPMDVPPLLWFTLQELHRVYGEVFGPYGEGPLPEPRAVRVHRPRRTSLVPAPCDGDVGSEADEWDEEEVLLPPTRMTKPQPHVNVLRRLLECHALAGCYRLTSATQVQRQCSGLSLLLRRSYDHLKSLVLDMLHIAHVELAHRRALGYPVDGAPAFTGAARQADSFSVSIQTKFAGLLGAMAYPHQLSRSALSATKAPVTSAGDESPEAAVPTSIRTATGIVDATVINTEQLLARASGDASTARLGADFQCVAPGVYVTPFFVSERQWIRDVGALREHATAQQTSQTKHPQSKFAPRPAAVNHSDEQNQATSNTSTMSPLTSDVDPMPATPGGAAQGPPIGMDWWALSPLPVCYVAGIPFALVPRANGQEVQGLPAVEHVELSVVAARLDTDSGVARGAAVGVHPEVEDVDAPVSYTSHRDDRLTTFDQVVDGVVARRRSRQSSALPATSLSLAAHPQMTPTLRGAAPSTTTTEAALDALLSSSLKKEEANLRRLLVDQLVRGGGLVYYAASGGAHGQHSTPEQEEEEDDKDQSTLLQWASLSSRGPHVTASLQVATANQLYKRFFEWVPAGDVGRSNDGNSATSGRAGRYGRDGRSGGGCGEPPLRTSQENSISGRSGRRRSLGRSTDALNRLRDSIMSSQRLFGTGSGNSSPHISTSISPSTTSRADPLASGALEATMGGAGVSEGSPMVSRQTSSPFQNTNSSRAAGALHNRSPTGTGGLGTTYPSTLTDAGTPSSRQDARRRRRRLENAREDVKSAQDVAAYVAAHHSRDGVDLHYHRPWFLAMPFMSVLPRMELFVDAVLASLKARVVVVLAADVRAAPQGQLVASAALLSMAVARVEAGKVGTQSTVAAAQSSAAAPQAPPQCAQRRLFPGIHATDDDDGLRDEEAAVTLGHPKLRFLQGFLEILSKEVHRHGVQLDVVVARVESVLSSTGLPLLQDIVASMTAAEQEPRSVPCRQCILAAVRTTELFCLLILFDTYLSLPFVASSLDRESTAPLTSFTTCVKSMPDVAAWIESIDPWQSEPHASPDPVHLRYSNWLRRWDDTHCICHGAI